MPFIYDGLEYPIELSPGGGDLRFSGTPSFGELWTTLGSYTATSVALAGGRRVSYAQLFLHQPMVAAAVNWLLAESLRVPLKVYRRTGDDSRERLRPQDHPLAEAVVNPWLGGSAGQLVMAMLGSLSVHGNGLLEVDSGASGKIAFREADYRFARPIMPWRDSIHGWVLDSDSSSMRRTVAADAVVHAAWWSPFGPIGVSPLQQLGVTINIEDAAQRHQEGILTNSARPPSAITASADFLGLEREQREALLKQLRGDLTTLYSGPENSGRPALLPPGLDWKMVGHTAVEAELIEQRMVARAEIGAVYRIAPGCFGFGLDKGGHLADQRTMSYMDGLLPPLILIEQAINAQVVKGLLREDDIFVEFDSAGILRGDRLAEVEALRESIATALLTPNEGRAILNMPESDIPAMDEFFLPRNNLIPVGQPYVADGMHLPAADPVPATEPPATQNVPADA
jgi:HK97 family phage portal protein